MTDDQILWLTSLVGLGAAGVIGYLVALWPSESPRPPANVDAETERRGREQAGPAAHGMAGGGSSVARVPCATPFLDKHAPGFVAKARKPKPKTKRKPKR